MYLYKELKTPQTQTHNTTKIYYSRLDNIAKPPNLIKKHSSKQCIENLLRLNRMKIYHNVMSQI